MMRGARIGWEMSQRDHDWIDEGVAWGWTMPAKAHPLLRAYGIRHVRAGLLMIYAYLALVPQAPNWRLLWEREWRAYAIRRGWC